MAFCYAPWLSRTGKTDKANCMQKELLNDIISIVTELTEISQEELLSRSRRTDVIEARYLLIYTLHSQGIKTYKIAKLLNIPERSIYYSITSFSVRSDQDGSMMKAWYTEIKLRLQKLRNSPDKSLS